jgi:hypothetical protein
MMGKKLKRYFRGFKRSERNRSISLNPKIKYDMYGRRLYPQNQVININTKSSVDAFNKRFKERWAFTDTPENRAEKKRIQKMIDEESLGWVDKLIRKLKK